MDSFDIGQDVVKNLAVSELPVDPRKADNGHESYDSETSVNQISRVGRRDHVDPAESYSVIDIHHQKVAYHHRVKHRHCCPIQERHSNIH